jgi:murein DD-endopeptidase MepM/ murein hydrolase activator NlpD
MATIEFKGEQAYSIDSDIWAGRIEEDAPSGSDYIIAKQGETIYSIAKKHNVIFKEIAAANHLKSPYVISPGQKIIIPQIEQHKVTPNETLSGIARDNNISENDLALINDLEKPHLVKPEQKIKVKQDNEIAEYENVRPKKKEVILHEKNKESSSLPAGGRQIKIVNPKIKFIWPIHGKVIANFGPQDSGTKNDGINISVNEGMPVYASAKGKVIYSSNELGKYGNLVIIKHDFGWFSAYAHLREVSVEKGDLVSSGEIIAKAGKTGNVNSAQLHFALRSGKNPVDPMRFLPKKIDTD